MDNKRIVYKNSLGGLSVITPNSECGLSLEEIAKKDVPKNIPYKIIEVTDLPSDREDRNAWDIEFTNEEADGIGEGV